MATVMRRLQSAALLAAGLGPFVSWWLRAEGNLYLAAAAAGGIGAGLWFLHELGALLGQLFRRRGAARQARAARFAQVAVFYGLLVPAIGVYVCFAVALAAFPGTIVADLHQAWVLLPPPIRFLMLLVVLNLAWLTWCAHGVLAAGMEVAGSEELAQE